MIADRPTTAAIFGVSTDAIRQWQKSGCPYIPPKNPRGTAAERRTHYCTVRVHRWLLQRELARYGLASVPTGDNQMAELAALLDS